jgi:hypothetical protein
MKPEYDFSRGYRGKFYRPNAELRLPIYLNADVQAYLAERAAQKGTLWHALLQKWGLPTDFEERTPLCSDYVPEIGWLSHFWTRNRTNHLFTVIYLI